MNNAYAYGYDYDNYRNYSKEFPSDDVMEKAAVRPPQKVLWLSIVCVVVTLLAWYSLRFIPLFDIKKVVVSSTGVISAVPKEAKILGASVLGKSMASSAPKKLKHALASLAMVEEVRLSRQSFSTLEVNLTIFQPAIGIAVVKEETTAALYLVKGEKLEKISQEDFSLYGNSVFTVEVNPTYGDYLVAYGLDTGMQEVIALASQMGMDTGGHYRIVSRIRYQESLGKTFGNMVIDLPAYNSSLYIREPLSESRLRDALRLIKLEREDDQIRNIALIGQLRYDLYARSLVSRQ